MNYNSPLTPKGGTIQDTKNEITELPLWGLGGLTIIIPTYNGAKKVVNCLHSLEKQTYQNFETIVVIDGSTDNTQEILNQQKWDLKDFKVIFQENKGRASVRNTGVKHAKGDLLLFLDDDMRLETIGVEKHLLHHQNIYNKNHISNNNHNDHNNNINHVKSILVGNQIEDFNTITTDIQHYKAFLSRKWVETIESNTPMPKTSFFLTAANFSILKTDFNEINGFDEKLTDAEDYDLAKKAIEQGFDIYFDNEIIGWHDDFITCASYIKRQKQYKTSHLTLKGLYPERYAQNQYIQKPAKGLKKMIYWLFSADFWVNMIDENNFFKCNFLKILPQKLRYKIYDIVITAQAVHFPK